MKNTKKFFALLLALSMVLSLGVTALAADGKGSITVENTMNGTAYSVYKIFDLTYVEDEEATPALPTYVDGVVTSPVSYFYTGTAAQALILDNTVADEEGGTPTTPSTPFQLTPVAGTESGSGATATMKYTVALREGKDAATVTEFLTANLADIAGTAAATGTGTGQQLEFTNLDYGYYYITSSLGTVVTIDSMIPDVTVIDKNTTTPSWDNDPENPNNPEGGDGSLGKAIVITNADGTKSLVSENTVNYGDTVDFSIAVNAKAYVKDEAGDYNLATYYYITDELDPGFTAPGTITVKVIPTKVVTEGGVTTVEYDDENAETLTAVTDYRLVQDGNKFAIRIPFGTKFGQEAKIEVTYSATVKNTDAVVLGPTGNLNTADYDYDLVEDDPNKPSDEHNFDPNPDDNDPDAGEEYPDPKQPFGDEDPVNPTDPSPDDVIPEPKDPKHTTTYVYGLDVFKYTGTDTALAGAKFTLQSRTANPAYVDATTTPDVDQYIDTPVPLAVDGDAANTTASFDYSSTGTYGDSTNPLITMEDGKLVVKGLKEGTYVLTEIEAPKGYNQLANPIVFTLDKNDTATTTAVSYIEDEDGEYALVGGEYVNPIPGDYEGNKYSQVTSALHDENVLNNSGTELPSTGGIGVTVFYVLGGILLVGAAVLLITKRRMSVNA